MEVKVKPLEWERYGFDDWRSETEIGKYHCIRTSDDTSVLWLNSDRLKGYSVGSQGASIAAKAAAQADYEARIRSAIIPPTLADALALPEIAALVEAGTVMANALKGDYIVAGSAAKWDAALAALTEKE